MKLPICLSAASRVGYAHPYSTEQVSKKGKEARRKTVGVTTRKCASSAGISPPILTFLLHAVGRM